MGFVRTLLYWCCRVKSERCVKLDGSKLDLLMVAGRNTETCEPEAGLLPLSGAVSTKPFFKRALRSGIEPEHA
jgi:hypothetical protein